ncbi:MAG: DUF2304 domain-containing protein [Lentisphaeria bacterium]|nr:DUF2304 domain-containing protein [Lentisphaeria bacterium]
MAIRVILIGGLVILTLVCLLALKSRLATRLFVAAQLLLGIGLVLFPETTNRLATLVGVGRGTDLLFYIMVLVGYAVALVVLAKFRHLERQITEIARQVALQNAKATLVDSRESSQPSAKQD